MVKSTTQLKAWGDMFGKEYTDRNIYDIGELDGLYRRLYGMTRTSINREFLDAMPRDMRILEVGANAGNQLLLLQKMGFTDLYGIEINPYAVEQAGARTRNINIIRGSAFDVPFKDGYFDMVFTSGVLIHISPRDIKKALAEIYRCSGKYIWGLEYHADKYTQVVYRGKKNLLWKTDFMKLYLDTFKGLKMVKAKRLYYLDNNNQDMVYLLKKKK